MKECFFKGRPVEDLIEEMPTGEIMIRSIYELFLTDEDTFFEEIYADFFINRVYASRAINANPSKRGKLTELLICNYRDESYGAYAAEEMELFDKAV